MSYIGNPPVVQTNRLIYEEVVTVAGKTDFYPPGGYTVGANFLDVELNGNDLGSADFTATDGALVRLAVGAGIGDLVRIIAYGTSTLSNATPADGSVTTAKVANGAITPAKMSGSGVPSFDGIKFPAAQVASADANTLDDYEEGTWTPTQGSGLTVVGSFSSSGKYVKIGKQVTVYFSVQGSTSVACGAASQICGGLPYAGDGSLYIGGISDSSNANLGLTLQYISGMYSTTAISARTYFVGSATYFTA